MESSLDQLSVQFIHKIRFELGYENFTLSLQILSTKYSFEFGRRRCRGEIGHTKAGFWLSDSQLESAGHPECIPDGVDGLPGG